MRWGRAGSELQSQYDMPGASRSWCAGGGVQLATAITTSLWSLLMMEIDGTWWAWAVTALVLFLGELLFIGFYLLPLGIAALIAAGSALLSPLPADPYGWLVPCVVFLAAAPILMVTLRPFMVRLMYTGGRRLNLDALVGQEARVTEAIDVVTGKGQVRIDRETWSASSAQGQPIQEGVIVDVLEIRGNRAIVKPRA